MTIKISRRNFLQFGAGFGALAAFGNLGFLRAAKAASTGDYKALVCVYLAGGNDGHNTVVPVAGSQYQAYTNIRGGLALAPNNLTSYLGNTNYALHKSLAEMAELFNSKKLAIVANVGNLVKPTTKNDLSNLPTQLFSHFDQMVQIQTGAANSSLGTGWGGRVADAVKAANALGNFPDAISVADTVLFCTGGQIKSAKLQPGNDLSQTAMTFYPQTAANARALAQKEILAIPKSTELAKEADKVFADALDLNPILKNAQGNPGFSVQFPLTGIGKQLKEIARLIGLRGTLQMNRQVFFCQLDGFDTHTSQDWTHANLLQQLSQALSAFYSATQEMGVANQVTTFTTSEFGRTLQPSLTGSDHGWGNHHLVLGGATAGGSIYGTFPQTALGGADDYDFRGITIPTTSFAQYGATLAKWFGVTDAVQLDALFPPLANFADRDLGFMN